jgi:large subunit ribosomal protein L25
MPEITSLRAEPRLRAGKGPSRAMRRAGRVPAILYGDKQDTVLLSLEPRELSRALARRGFFATLVDLQLDGTAHRALPRDVQFDPVTDVPLHVDFMRVAADARVNVTVPVVFINHDAAPGLRRGGILNVVRHDLELNCPVAAIPTQVTIDLTGLDIGHSLHISAVALPEGVRSDITERDFTVATISSSSALREEAAAAAAAPPAPEPEQPEEQPERTETPPRG